MKGFFRSSVGLSPSPGISDPMTRARMAAILYAMPEPMLLVGRDQRILLANPAAAEMLGGDLEGKPVFAVIRQPEASVALRSGLAANSTAPVEARLAVSDKSGETIYRMIVHPLKPEAELDAALVSFRDIGHIEAAEQIRRDFIANVSHELRSPLTVLTGFVETLRDAARDDPTAREEILEIMAREAQRMARLVADLLSLSWVEANERIRPRDPVVLRDVIDATRAALAVQLRERSVRLMVSGLEDNLAVPGDLDQLVQVFHNLIENAIRYGGSGGRVDVSAIVQDRVPGIDGPAVAVSVTDHGEGIDPLHLPRLTERFYRVDAHRSREVGGTGLGLAIVKHIINRHRGRLNIRSAPGEGSTFTVILPRSVEPKLDAPQPV